MTFCLSMTAKCPAIILKTDVAPSKPPEKPNAPNPCPPQAVGLFHPRSAKPDGMVLLPIGGGEANATASPCVTFFCTDQMFKTSVARSLSPAGSVFDLAALRNLQFRHLASNQPLFIENPPFLPLFIFDFAVLPLLNQTFE
jgi:hypothetical protein